MKRRFAILSCLVLGACVTSDPALDDRVVQTAIALDPIDFLGQLPCAAAPGAAQSYIATAVDIETGARIGPSVAVSCGTPLAFQDIEIDHRYGAEVLIFDVPPDQAVAASPAWSTTCGLNGTGSALVNPGALTYVRGCVPISADGTNSTGVSVDASAVAASVGCGIEPGQVATLDVVPLQGMPQVTIACGQPAIVYGAGLTANQRVAFQITGRDANGTPSWGSSCEATTQQGIIVPATCGPLIGGGALRFPVQDSAAAAGKVCGETSTHAKVAVLLGDQTVPSASVPCNADVSTPALPVGSYLASLDYYAGEALVAAFSCTASTLAGQTVDLVCTRED